MKRPVEESSSDPASIDDDTKTNKKPKPDLQDPNQEPNENSSAVSSDLYQALRRDPNLVVLALGGFCHLHSLYLWPLSKPSSSAAASASSSTWPCFSLPAPVVPAKSAATEGVKKWWGKDEVHLSLSLLSIWYYEKMNFNNRGK